MFAVIGPAVPCRILIDGRYYTAFRVRSNVTPTSAAAAAGLNDVVIVPSTTGVFEGPGEADQILSAMISGHDRHSLTLYRDFGHGTYEPRDTEWRYSITTWQPPGGKFGQSIRAVFDKKAEIARFYSQAARRHLDVWRISGCVIGAYIPTVEESTVTGFLAQKHFQGEGCEFWLYPQGRLGDAISGFSSKDLATAGMRCPEELLQHLRTLPWPLRRHLSHLAFPKDPPPKVHFAFKLHNVDGQPVIRVAVGNVHAIDMLEAADHFRHGDLIT